MRRGGRSTRPWSACACTTTVTCRSGLVLLLTMHHIVSDGWSIGLLMREVATIYAAFVRGKNCPLPDLELQYCDYAVWQRQTLESGALQPELDYWTTQLKALPALQLPTDRARRLSPTHEASVVKIRIDEVALARLKRFAHERGVTLFMLLVAALQHTLSRWSGQEDVAVGTPVANRQRAEDEALVGFFVNTVVLRAKVRSEITVGELLRCTREMCLDAFARQSIPFSRVVEALNPVRDRGRSPLFQVWLSLQHAPPARVEWPALHLEVLPPANDLPSSISN